MLPQQLFQQPEPQNKVSAFMDKTIWPIVVTIVGTPVAAIIVAVWLGSIHILNFDWLMLILGFIMVVIASFSAWYSHRTRILLQNKYNKDIEALKKEYYAFQRNFTDMANNEFNRLNSGFVDYTLANSKEQREQLEEMRKQMLEKIQDAENGMGSGIKNVQSIFTGAVKSYEISVE